MQDRRDIITPAPAEAKTDLQKPFEPRLPTLAEPYSNYRGSNVPEEGVRFAEYWRAIRKRLWLVIGVVVLMMTLSAIYMARRPDIYLATAQVQVDLETENPDLRSNDGRAPRSNTDPAFFNTQLQKLNSPQLLRRVIKETNLEGNKDFQINKDEESRSGLNGILKRIGLAAGDDKNKNAEDTVPEATSSSITAGEDLAEAKRLAPLVETLKKKLTVEPVRENRAVFKDTRLINISYEHTNPELAALIVNSVAETFTKANSERKTSTSSKTNEYLKERIVELQAEVKRDEEQYAKLKNDANIIELDKDKTLALRQLEELNGQLLKAQETRKGAEAEFKVASQPGALDALTQNSAARKYIDDTKLDLARMRQEKEKLAEEFTNEAPEIKELEKQIASREKDLINFRKNQEEVFKQQLKTRFDSAQRQEQQIQTAYQAAYSQAQVQTNSGINIKLLEQRLNANKETLNNLLKTSRDNDITAAGTENNVSISDVAIPPKDPIGPRRLTSVLMAGLLAGLFGCGLALFLEYLDDSIKTTDDVENVLRMPTLAVIPAISAMAKRKLALAAGSNGGNNSTALAELNGGGRSQEVLITNDSRSALAEAYRQLRTSVLLSTAGHAPKSLLITSSVPSEGKTTTAVNTATSLAQTGAKVLIIDADMRRPRLHNIFGVENSRGLSTILSSAMAEKEVLAFLHYDEESKIYILPSGPVPPNPAELIGSEQMANLMSYLHANFTHVVFDSPPIASFTDGVLIGSIVDGVILVVHAGKSSRQVVRRSKQLLSDVGAKVFGVVLNNINVKTHDNHYYQSYYNKYYDGN